MNNELAGWDCFWIPIRDGDARALSLFLRHYTALPYRRTGGRRNRLFVGPGEKLVLLSPLADALFVWRKFIDKSGQRGINCAVFRNEGPYLSSAMIIEAERWAWDRWPGTRLYTYVNAKKVRSVNPGCCFKKAGWRMCGRTKSRGLLILEKCP